VESSRRLRAIFKSFGADLVGRRFASKNPSLLVGARRAPLGASPRRRKLLLLLASAGTLAALVLGVSLASAAAPTVTIEGASAVRYTTATAKGKVDPADHETSYRFQYVSQENFEASEWAEASGFGFGSLPEGSGPTPVEGAATELKPATTYHLRLLAENVEGESAEAIAAAAFTTEAVAAPTASIETPGSVTATSAVFSGHVNPNAPKAEGSTDAAEQEAFRSSWHFVCAPLECPGLEGTVEAGDTPHAVSATATGLLPGTTYEVHLVATNAGGPGESPVETFTTPAVAPTISATAATGTTGSEATLTAQINPGGSPTTYHFEYLTDAQFQAGGYGNPAVSSTSPTALGAGNETLEALATVSGLVAGTTYHFRAVATNGSAGNPVIDSADRTFIAFAGTQPGEGQTCPNEAIRAEQGTLALPDCRAYEMVTPPFKYGQYPIVAGSAVSDDETAAISFSSLGGFNDPGNDSSTEGGEYIASRSASGWQTAAVNPLAAEFQGGATDTEGVSRETLDYSADLTHTLFLKSPAGKSPIDFRFYIRDALTGSVQEIGPAVPPAEIADWTPEKANAQNGAKPKEIYLGATPNFSQVFFNLIPTNPDAVWPGDQTALGAGGAESLYTHTGAGQTEPELVAVTNEQTLSAAAAEQGDAHINEAAELISQCGARLGGNYLEPNTYNAISNSGKTVFFTVKPGGCANEGGPIGTGPPVSTLYARLRRSHTVAISEPGPASCEQCDISEENSPAFEGSQSLASFQGASRDGSRAFFTTIQKLFVGTDGESGTNLYEYDFNAPQGDRVSLVASELTPGGGEASTSAENAGVLRISEGGQWVYFVSGKVLAGNPGPAGGSAAAGAINLYAYNTQSHSYTFVSQLSAGDARDWAPVDARNVEATPDGRFLLFRSVAALTPDAAGPGRQLYRYEAPTEANPHGLLIRISRSNDGFNNDGNSVAPPSSPFSPEYERKVQPSFSRQDLARTSPEGITVDGSKVFFESPAALTPGALNQACSRERGGTCTTAAQNIYEWENGHVRLLSDGRDTHSIFGSSATKLLGANGSGSQVYFTTADPLLNQDGDTQLDIYDAAEFGGFTPPPSVVACSGESCQGPGAAPPSTSTPASTTIQGSNAKPKAHKRRHRRHRKHPRHRGHGRGGPRGRSADRRAGR
jgi:hypothetical protein